MDSLRLISAAILTTSIRAVMRLSQS